MNRKNKAQWQGDKRTYQRWFINNVKRQRMRKRMRKISRRKNRKKKK